MATMSVCYDCQQLTAGRCWRHQNAELINQRPAPPPPFNNGQSLVAMAHQDAEQRERIAELEAENERLRSVVMDAARCRSSDAWGMVALAAQEALASGQEKP